MEGTCSIVMLREGVSFERKMTRNCDVASSGVSKLRGGFRGWAGASLESETAGRGSFVRCRSVMFTQKRGFRMPVNYRMAWNCVAALNYNLTVHVAAFGRGKLGDLSKIKADKLTMRSFSAHSNTSTAMTPCFDDDPSIAWGVRVPRWTNDQPEAMTDVSLLLPKCEAREHENTQIPCEANVSSPASATCMS